MLLATVRTGAAVANELTTVAVATADTGSVVPPGLWWTKSEEGAAAAVVAAPLVVLGDASTDDFRAAPDDEEVTVRAAVMTAVTCTGLLVGTTVVLVGATTDTAGLTSAATGADVDTATFCDIVRCLSIVDTRVAFGGLILIGGTV